MNGALWAAAAGVGFGLFQSVNRQAVRELDDAYVSTFLQPLAAAVVLVVASVSTDDVGRLANAPAWALLAFAAAGGVRAAGPVEARFGLGCAAVWALSPVLTVAALDGLGSPLLGVTLGLLAAVAGYGAVLVATGRELRLGAVAHRTLAVKLLAGVLVALATWWRWVVLDHAAVGVVLAMSLLSVPIILFLAPRLAGRHLEHARRGCGQARGSWWPGRSAWSPSAEVCS